MAAAGSIPAPSLRSAIVAAAEATLGTASPTATAAGSQAGCATAAGTDSSLVVGMKKTELQYRTREVLPARLATVL
jgi:hypothetical protein